MRHACRAALVALVVMALPGSLPGQAGRPSFEVASVKRNTAGEFPDFEPRRSGDRVAMHNIRTPAIVIYAYHLAHQLATTSYQLEGNASLPEGWDVWDVDAIAPASTSNEDIRLMFRTLLEDRFKLKTHWETRQIYGFDLTVAKGGPKLKRTTPESKQDRDTRRAPREPGMSRLAGSELSIEHLADALSGRLELPVRNLTGLTGGSYDVDLQFVLDPVANATPGPSLITAAEQELGLKLRAGKGPVQVLVVDHIEKPRENE